MATKDEIGIIFRGASSFDMSSETALEITFTKPDATTLVVDKSSSPNAVSLETSPVTGTVLGDIAANESVKYTFASGDLDQSGEWTARLKYTDATKTLISAIGNFTVNA
jgi:hypothetical protein